MPVDYTIAARGAQANTAPDFANTLAQYQMMAARAQQEQLQQLQMQKLQQEQEHQNALSSLLGRSNFNLMAPQAINAIAAHDPALAIQLANAQRMQQHYGALESQAAQELQAKLPVYGAQVAKEQRLGEEAAAKAEKTAYERDAEVLKKHENLAAKIVMNGGKGYDNFYKNAPAELKPYLSPNYDEDMLTNFTTQMATVQENLKRAHEFELVDRINPDTGLKEKIAVPKYAPEKGGKPVAGTQGAIPDKYKFMAGPEGTGTVIRTNEAVGTAESLPISSGIPAPRVQAAPEGKLTPRVDMTAPPSAPANVPEPVPGTPEYTNRKFANQVFKDIEYNPKTGDDRLSKLIKQSTSGGLESAAAGVSGFFGRSTPGAKAIAQIGTLVNNIVLERMNGKLGAGVSNEDREFFKSLQGNLDNPSIPVETRLAAWNEAKRRMAKYSSDFSVSSAPSAGSVIDFGDLK